MNNMPVSTYDLIKVAETVYPSLESNIQYIPKGFQPVLEEFSLKYENSVTLTGFKAIILKNDDKKQIIIGFTGTNNSLISHKNFEITTKHSFFNPISAAINDISNNLSLLAQVPPKQLKKQTKQLLDQLRQQIPPELEYDIHMTGHSKGGALAEAAAGYMIAKGYNVHAKVFDSPGAKEVTRKFLQSESYSKEYIDEILKKTYENVNCYVAMPNFINTCAEHIGKVLHVNSIEYPYHKSHAPMLLQFLISTVGHTTQHFIDNIEKDGDFKENTLDHKTNWVAGRSNSNIINYFFSYKNFPKFWDAYLDHSDGKIGLDKSKFIEKYLSPSEEKFETKIFKLVYKILPIKLIEFFSWIYSSIKSLIFGKDYEKSDHNLTSFQAVGESKDKILPSQVPTIEHNIKELKQVLKSETLPIQENTQEVVKDDITSSNSITKKSSISKR